MHSVFPGKPQLALQAVDNAFWNGVRIVAYVSGSNLILLRGPHDLLQTISLDDTNALEAVAIDPLSGKIAVTDRKQVFIYHPIGQEYGALRWTLQAVSSFDEDHGPISCLSWGLPGELLVSSSRLILLTTDSAFRTVWQSRLLANPVKSALFSHDASLIASCGHHDRLVKVWRRGFIGGGNERFDPVYVGHPAAVTSMRWRKRRPQQEDREDENSDPVLYTTCTDGKLRVWTAHDPHCLQVLRLWAELDMFTAIQPREPLSPGAGSKRRCAAILDHWEFEAAVSAACQTDAGEERKHHTRKHLQELADRSPEVAIFCDNESNMSAWGLERVACKARQPNDVLNLTNVEGLGLEPTKDLSPTEDYTTLSVFSVGPRIHFLVHYFDGRLQWLSGLVDHLFDPSPDPNALELESELTGHADSIERVFSSGDSTISISHDNEIIAWRRGASTLIRQSHGKIPLEPVLDAKCVSKLDMILILTTERLVLIDAGQIHMRRVADVNLKRSEGHPEACLSPLHRLDENTLRVGVAFCLSDGLHIDVFEVDIAQQMMKKLQRQSPPVPSLSAHDSFLDESDRGHTLVANFQSSPNAVATLSPSSNFEVHNIGALGADSIRTLQKVRSVPVATQDSSIISSNGTFLAYTNVAALTLIVVNVLTSFVEFTRVYDAHDPVRSIRWTNSAQKYPVALAVLFARKVSILGPGTCEPTSSSAWSPLFEISLTELSSNPITDSCWISPSRLLVATGTQLFAFHVAPDVPEDRYALYGLSNKTSAKRSLAKVVQGLNNSLPLYHPASLEALLESGDFELFLKVLRQLDAALKYFAEGDAFSSVLDQDISHVRSSILASSGNALESSSSSFTPDELSALLNRLKTLPWLSDGERDRVKTLARSSVKLAEQQQSVDAYASQFLASLYLAPSEEFSSMAIFQASQTTSHDILVEQIAQAHNDQLSWSTARRTGLFLWLPSADSVRTHLESVARAEYTSTRERNPVDCALFYLALRKKAVLANLWRIATWHKEQRATHKMLQNDFNDARWRTAALKNAYALLGKRRAQYAAAWFLLADDLHGAVGVLAAQCDDLRLAVAVARAYEGDAGPVLRELLEDKVLPRAAADDDRYLAAWAFWLLGRKDMMLRAFIDSFPTLVPSNPKTPPLRTLRRSDPALARTYLRARTSVQADPRAAKAAHGLSVSAEHNLVRRCALIYMRMGLGPLAIDLLRTFTFSIHIPSTTSQPTPPQPQPQTEETPSALDAFFATDDPPIPPAEPQPKQPTPQIAPSALDAFFADDASSTEPANGASALDSPRENGGAERREQEGVKGETKKKPAAAPSERSILDDFDF